MVTHDLTTASSWDAPWEEGSNVAEHQQGHNSCRKFKDSAVLATAPGLAMSPPLFTVCDQWERSENETHGTASTLQTEHCTRSVSCVISPCGYGHKPSKFGTERMFYAGVRQPEN